MTKEKLLCAIAEAYEAMPSGRTGAPAAERSYEAFRLEVVAMHAAIPVRVEPWERDGQPYADSFKMFTDIELFGRLSIYQGGEDHPYFSRAENVMVRAVHDYFGHFLGRYQFGPVGELLAWKAHCKHFSGDAIPAMTADFLGQNCWVNYGVYRHLPPAVRPYPEQKASLLPEELWLPLLVSAGEVMQPPAWLMRFPPL